MRNVAHTLILALGCAFSLVPHVASAQAAPSQNPNPKRVITYRGLEMGVDVTAGRSGEFVFYTGASSTRGSLAVRFSKMDAGAAVPCSAGVLYEYLFGKDRARITPVAGASLARVFSCAGDSDGVRPNPAAHAFTQFSGGVRVPMFAGTRIVGSLKVLGFAQRQFGPEPASDVTSKGVTLGFVVGRR
jgi:hypothetical protein